MLRKIIIALTKEAPEEEISGFKQMLEEAGIEAVFGIDEKADFGESGDTLYISSVPQLCSKVVERGGACIAYLGEGAAGEFEKVRYAIESFEGIDSLYLERIRKRYAKEPWEILRTKRCVVRETTTEDVEAFYKIYAEPSITAHMEALFENKEEEINYTKNYIENIYGFYEYGLWTVLEQTSGEVIGRAGISWREDTETAELGYVIAKPFQRKGYAYEVCSAILEYAAKELVMEEVSAYIKEENEPSKALCRKLGFAYKEKIVLEDESYEKFTKKLER